MAGEPPLRQTSFNQPDTSNTVIRLSTECLSIQLGSNRKLMAFYMDSYSCHLMSVTNNVTQIRWVSVLGTIFSWWRRRQWENSYQTPMTSNSFPSTFHSILLSALSALETLLHSVYKYKFSCGWSFFLNVKLQLFALISSPTLEPKMTLGTISLTCIKKA